MKPDLLILRPLRPRQMALLEQRFTLFRLDRAADPDGMIASIAPGCEALVTSGGTGLDRALIERLPRLKLAASFGVGFDTIDIAACNEHGVKVTNTPDVLTDDVADAGLMLILAARRALISGDRHVRSGAWGREGAMPLTSSIRGKRLGIVGLGRIGRALAARGAALGLAIGYTARSRKVDADHRYFDDLAALAAWADILAVTVTGGARTQGLISAPVIAALGREGTLVNIARGSVVDEPALLVALQSGALGSAGLDVFMNEPHPDPAFAALDNVVLYPHHASGTVETRDAMAQLVVDNLDAYFAGRPLLTPVN